MRRLILLLILLTFLNRPARCLTIGGRLTSSLYTYEGQQADTTTYVRAHRGLRLDAYTGGTKAPTIPAQDLFDNLNDGDASNDPVVLSVRSAAHYAIGHIPGAINIPWREIAKTDNLKKLPTDRQIVVYCYTGHTGAVATTALNMLGYDAVNLRHGIMSWTRDPDVRVAAPFSEETDAHDFPVE